MSGGKLYSFRIKDAEIEQALAAIPERSDFIRRAIFEKLQATGDVRSGMPSESSPLALDQPSDPLQPRQSDVERLRIGLMAIAHSTTAILDAGGEDVPELVRVGLVGISETAAILAAEGQGGGEKGHPPVAGSVPAPDAKTSNPDTTASHQSDLPLFSAPHTTAPKQTATPDPEDSQ